MTSIDLRIVYLIRAGVTQCRCTAHTYGLATNIVRCKEFVKIVRRPGLNWSANIKTSSITYKCMALGQKGRNVRRPRPRDCCIGGTKTGETVYDRQTDRRTYTRSTHYAYGYGRDQHSKCDATPRGKSYPHANALKHAWTTRRTVDRLTAACSLPERLFAFRTNHKQWSPAEKLEGTTHEVTVDSLPFSPPFPSFCGYLAPLLLHALILLSVFIHSIPLKPRSFPCGLIRSLSASEVTSRAQRKKWVTKVGGD